METQFILIFGVVVFGLFQYGETGVVNGDRKDLDIRFQIFSSDKCYAGKGTYTKLLNVPLLHCVVDCATRPKCVAVNHRYNENTCELVSEEDYENQESGPCQFIKKSDMSVGNIPCKTCNMMQACDILLAECVYKECPFPEIPNASVFGYQNSVGSSIRVLCHLGYKPVGGAVVAMCLNNGQWSQTPRCVLDESFAVDQGEPVLIGNGEHAGTSRYKGANCTSHDIRTTDDWCMFNCNHIPPNCPEEFCSCDGNIQT
ncbi:hypothetical protein ACF0H5_017382 [Mactra antiquata]